MNHESKTIRHNHTVTVTSAPHVRMFSGKMLSPTEVDIRYSRDVHNNGDIRHSCSVVVSGLQVKKDGEVGVASGSVRFYSSKTSKMSDWPDWIQELAEHYEPWDRL